MARYKKEIIIKPAIEGQIVEMTDEDRATIKELAAHGMNIEQIANVMNYRRRTLYRRIFKDDELKAVIEEGRSEGLAQVTKTAFQLAVSGECPPMTMFFLKTRGGWRETDKKDEGASDLPKNIEITKDNVLEYEEKLKKSLEFIKQQKQILLQERIDSAKLVTDKHQTSDDE